MAHRQSPLRVLTYMRTSARHSSRPTDEQSVQAQADRVRAYAESLGWPLIPVYQPDEASNRQQPWDRREP